MHTETHYLKTIIQEIITQKSTNPDKPNPHLQTEVTRLEQTILHQLNAISNQYQRELFQQHTLNKLVEICDQLYTATKILNPDVLFLIHLISNLRHALPAETRPNIKLPKAFLALQKTTLETKWDQYREYMQQQKFDPALISIAGVPFRRFTEARQTFYWTDYTWLKGYQAKLDILNWQDPDCSGPQEALISLLIGRDFNDDRFYIYCKKYVQERTRKISGKRPKLLEFAQCQKLILQDTQIGTPPFDAHANSLSTRLLKWVGEEMDFTEKYEREIAQSKFPFQWNVETIAFFFKLLWDHKVFGKLSLEPLSEQIAANCSSVGKDAFQATTIFSRFYVKDKDVIDAVEGVLSVMLEDVRRFG